MSIESELQQATSTRAMRNRGKYLEVLVERALALPEEGWAGLSAETQAWVNSNVQAYNDRRPLTDFEAEDAPTPETTPAPELAAPANDQNDTPSTTSEGESGETTPAPPRPRGRPPREVADGVKRGAQTRIKEIVVAEPSMTLDAVREALKTEGYVTSSAAISTIRSDFLHSLRVLKATGCLRDDFAARI